MLIDNRIKRKEKNQPKKIMCRFVSFNRDQRYYIDGRGDLRSKKRDVLKQAALYYGIRKKKKLRRWLKEDAFKNVTHSR